MRTIRRPLLIAGALTLGAPGGLTNANASDEARPAQTPAPAVSPKPRTDAAVNARPAAGAPSRPAPATRAGYWGPAPPPVPKKKPTAVGRFFNRIGTFLGADEEMGTTPTYRDPATGRTNTGASKPYMKRMEQ